MISYSPFQVLNHLSLKGVLNCVFFFLLLKLVLCVHVFWLGILPQIVFHVC